VATDGKDTWSGTLASPNAAGTDGPFATIQRGQAALRTYRQANPNAAAVVDVEGGTYVLSSALSFASSDSGVAGGPTVYEATPGSTVVISGGEQVTGWTQVSGNLWEAPAAGLQYFEQLYVNGVRHYRPQLPETGYYIASPVYSNYRTQACAVPVGTKYECYDRFQFHAGNVNASYYDMKDVEIYDFEDWTMPIMKLKSVDTENQTVFLTGTTSEAADHGFITGHRFTMANVKEAMAQTGQWYLDQPAGQILYLAAPGENPNSEYIVAPQLTQLLVANGVNYLTFKGLTFSYSNYVVPPGGRASVQGEALFDPVSAALSFASSSYVVFDGATVSHIGAYGIGFLGNGVFQPAGQGGYNDELVNSVVTDVGAGGIAIGAGPTPSDTNSNVAQYNLVENDVFSGIGRFLPAGYPIYVLNSHNNAITHNDVYDTYNTAIGLGGTYTSSEALPALAHDNMVSFNLIYDVGQGVTNDIGGIYIADYTATGNVFSNNVIHDVTHDPGNSSVPSSAGYGGWGIYFDADSMNVVAENNLVYDTSQASIHNNNGTNNFVLNNILAYGAQGIVDRSHDTPTLSITFEHNIVYWDKNSGQGSLQRGTWSCIQSEESAAKVPCASRFLLQDNLYWYLDGAPTFFTSSPTKTYSFSQWQGIGEDTGSLLADPMFANPTSPAYNFTLPANSPAFSVGFVAFGTSQAGVFPGTQLPPPVPVAFTLQLMSPGGF